MYRLIKVDTSFDVPCPDASLLADMPPSFPFNGGVSWKGLLDRPLAFAVVDNLERPAGLTDFFRTIHFRVTSAAFKCVLESVGAQIEFWPATIVYRGEQVAREYFVANPLIRLAALDLAKSQVKLTPMGTVLSADRVVLDEARFADHQWVAISQLEQLAVGPVLQEALNGSRLAGFRLVSPLSLRF